MEDRLPKRGSRSKAPSGESPAVHLPLDTCLFAAGDRVCVAVSGGADSTALLRMLVERQSELGVVLSVLHVQHGLRGVSANSDAAFVAALAEQYRLPHQEISVDTPKWADEHRESVEEAARNLRYEVFREVISSGQADKIATAHTLDDQAETVLMKMLRGSWTEGLSGIHPILKLDDFGHVCVRPLLKTTRAEVETYLREVGQRWCEDETNQSSVYTRNRVRHDLLPKLREYNPRVAHALAHIADHARAEERHWDLELSRLLPQLLLPGKPVRGGGRSVGSGSGTTQVGIEITRLQALDPGLCRRVLRAAAQQCGATLDFDTTERLLDMIEMKSGESPAGSAKRLELAGGVVVGRSAREIRFERQREMQSTKPEAGTPYYELSIPGTVEAPAFGARYHATLPETTMGTASPDGLPPAYVRPWQAGDRVELAHSSGPKKVKEVLERMGIRGEERTLWPVVVWRGRIIWMRGVRLAAESAEAQFASENGSLKVVNPTICEIRS